ncbi:hypothetical protein Nhal_2243 [Nitrosococcus halophilus Nc 4]|uniref:DUF6316 domain-containing protein n=1 Tax=Nitrosococcus halophilus (strain Nc4) TaxID=472759 RepID=D5C5B1_NITHN|nr:DUF6316 family protein [Nitrosococcus halophilus]ADE15334.1 hypothetical protein Nhal_2243 [Nitrosococcus halophilus Nc 4]
MVRRKTRFRCVAQRGWYFLTREGRIGPFDTRREAEEMCQRYLDEMVILRREQQGRVSQEIRKIA